MGSVTLREGFGTGLRPTSTTRPDSQALVECLNARPNQDGLITPILPAVSVTGSLMSPQYFEFQNELYLITLDGHLYKVNTDTWALTAETNIVYAPDGQIRLEDGGDMVNAASHWTLGTQWAAITGAVVHTAGSGSDYHYVEQACSLPPNTLITFVVTGINSETPPADTRIKVKAWGTESSYSTVATGTFTKTISVATDNGSLGQTIGVGVIDSGQVRIDDIKVYLTYAVPTLGGTWHIANHGDGIALFNGESVIYRTPTSTNWTIENLVGASTGDSFGGRLVQGGFLKETYWKPDWATYFGLSTVEPVHTDRSWDLEDMRPNENGVTWSTPNGGDAFALYDPDSAMSGVNGDAALAVMDTWLRGQAGDESLPDIGEVICIRAFSGGLIVYGTRSIYGMIPSGESFVFKRICDIGLADRGLVGTNQYEQVFVDVHGVLWRVRADCNIERFDYSEFLLPWLGSATEAINPSGTAWSLSGCTFTSGTYAKSSPGAATATLTIANQLNPMLDDTRVQVTFTATRSSATGAMWVSVGSNSTPTVVSTPSDEDHIVAVIGASASISIVTTSDWTGTVTNLSVKRLPQAYVSYDARWKEFYLTGRNAAANELETFVLGQGYFYELGYHPITVYNAPDSVKAIYAGTASPAYFWQTGPLEFGTHGTKTITRIHVNSVHTAADLHAQILFRFSPNSTWSYNGPAYFTEPGVIETAATGVQFCIRLVAANYAQITAVHDLTIEYEQQGKRNLYSLVTGPR